MSLVAKSLPGTKFYIRIDNHFFCCHTHLHYHNIIVFAAYTHVYDPTHTQTGEQIKQRPLFVQATLPQDILCSVIRFFSLLNFFDKYIYVKFFLSYSRENTHT